MDKGELWAEWTRRLRSLFPLPEGQTYENVQAVPGAPEQLFALISEQREDAARAEREANCTAIRAACGMCKDGVFERDPRDGSAIECEYCGRPIAAIRARGTEPQAREGGK